MKIEITLNDERKIRVELYKEFAPATVENFLKLVDMKYFDGILFHRVINNFMIQTGGYYIDGNQLVQKSDLVQIENIKGEFKANGFMTNTLKHELGTISMARTSDMNSASSQFFLCSATTPHLDGSYAAFGKTIDEESNKVILEISKVPTINIGYGFTDFPEEPIIIKSITRI